LSACACRSLPAGDATIGTQDIPSPAGSCYASTDSASWAYLGVYGKRVEAIYEIGFIVRAIALRHAAEINRCGFSLSSATKNPRRVAGEIGSHLRDLMCNAVVGNSPGKEL